MALKMTAREQKRIAQWNLIVDISRNLFKQYGFEQVTIDDICESAGISKSTLYLHIRSKEDLVMVYAAADRNDHLEAHFQYNESKPFKEQFFDFIIANFDYNKKSAREWNRLSYVSYIRIYRQNLDIENHFYKYTLMQLVRRGMKEGRFRAQLSEEEYYFMIHDWIIGFFIGWSIQPDGQGETDESYLRIIDGMVRSLLKD